MPTVELELSVDVYRRWLVFQGTTPAASLRETGLLGDWVALGFMANVERFLKAGAPDMPAFDEESVRQTEDAAARKRLAKAQKRILPVFNENETITASEAARVLGWDLAQGQAQMAAWLDEGFLANAGERGGEAAYTLSRDWQARNLAANRPSLNVPRVPHLMKPRRVKPEDEETPS
jgi:hypothetical protein